MSQTLHDPITGEDREFFTQEEIEEKEEAARQAAVDEFKQEYGDPDETKNALDAAKKELEDLKKAEGDKGSNLVKAMRALEGKISDLTKTHSEQITGLQQKMQEGNKDDAVKALSRGDAEIEKKIRHHFDATLATMPAGTKEEVQARALAAYKLSADAAEPDLLKHAFGTGGGQPPNQPGSGKVVQAAIDAAVAAGIAPDKAKAHAEKAASGGINIIRGDQG